eukprot:2717289-Ditylum_brightwellii.AAC.1
MSSFAKVKGCNRMQIHDYIQRIPLPQKDNYCSEECLLETAVVSPQGRVMGDDATVSPAILGYSSEDSSQPRSMKYSYHHDDEVSVASRNISVATMSAGISALAASALQQHQTAMLQQQMQQQAAQQFAFQVL